MTNFFLGTLMTLVMGVVAMGMNDPMDNPNLHMAQESQCEIYKQVMDDCVLSDSVTNEYDDCYCSFDE